MSLCEGLPPGCGVRVHHWPAKHWRAWRQPLRFLLQYQCQVLAGDVGSDTRSWSSAVKADDIDLHPDWDDLYLLTVGGVPSATAVVTATTPPGRWYIGWICGHTRTGAGAMLLQHLQSIVAATTPAVSGLALSAMTERTRQLYRDRGFRSLPEYPDGREMVWDVKARAPTQDVAADQ